MRLIYKDAFTMHIERLKYLTKKLRQSQLSFDEKRELDLFYDSFEHTSGYTDLIPQKSRSIYQESLYAHITHKGNKRKYTRILYWTASSAAAILILFLLNILFSTNKDTQPDLLLQAFYQPKEIASLITPKGEKMILTGEESFGQKDQLFQISKNENGYYYLYVDSALLDSKLPQQIRLKVEDGNTYPLGLSDGTQILLQGGSSISIVLPNKRHKERKVILEGQALFDVAKIKDSPFIIQTPHQQVRVLGTRFDLAAYREQSYEKVILYAGKVQLYNSNTQYTEILTPNTVSILDKNTQNYNSYPLEQTEEHNQMSSWIFEEETLRDISIRIQKLYSVRVEVDSTIAQKTFTGVIPRNMSLKNILDALQMTEQIDYYHKDNIIHITSKK